MSWFNRRPKTKEEPISPPKHSSPASERLMKETKKLVTEKKVARRKIKK